MINFLRKLELVFSKFVLKKKTKKNKKKQRELPFFKKIGTAGKSSKYGVISVPSFPVFGLNTGKYRPEITPYLDTFHAVIESSYLRFVVF